MVDGDRTSELLRTAILLRLTIAPVVVLAAVIWARLAHYGQDATVVLYAITIMSILTLLAEPLQAAFQATERMKYLAYGDMINKTLQSLVGIAVVVIGFGAIGIAVNMAIAAAVVALYYGLGYGALRIGTRTATGRWARWRRRRAVRIGWRVLRLSTSGSTRSCHPDDDGPRCRWYGATTSLFISLSFLPRSWGRPGYRDWSPRSPTATPTW